MKNLTLTLVALFLSFTLGFSQANSVTLKDALSNVIGSYDAIQDAYDAIPAMLTQAYTIEIEVSYNGADESYPVTFINKAGASATNTIRVIPAASVTSWKVIEAGLDTSSMFVLDNADWMVIGNGVSPAEIRFMNNALSPAFPMVQLINGSCNDVIINCAFMSYDFGLTSVGIKFGESNTDPSGNSDNKVENCHYNLCAYGITSEGTNANKNTHNYFYNLTFTTFYAAVYLGDGAGVTTIDSCIQQSPIYVGNVGYSILAEHLDDSLFVKNNRWKLYGVINAGTMSGLAVSNNTGENGYVSATNNFFVFDEALNQLIYEEDSIHEIFSMKFEGTGEIHADIYHNTVRVRGKYEGGGVPGNVNSAAFRKTATGMGSVYNIKNNLFLNERVDSSAGMKHLAMSIPETAGTININNNTYNVPGSDILTYGNLTYSSFTAYQAAIGGGNETNSNMAQVEFESPIDYRLYGSAVNNPALQGILIPAISVDIERDIRAYPYRGCDEYVVTCADDTPSASIQLPFGPVCYGTKIYLQYSPEPWGNGHYYQWQSRPAGSSLPFTDIPGYTHYFEFPTMYESTEYKLIDSCAGGSPIVSATGTVIVSPLPLIISISETHASYTYDFTAVVQNVTGYEWDFGDGSAISTVPAPQHTYNGDGNYTVTLMVSNSCGRDTAILSVPVSVKDWEKENVQVKIYPNPANSLVSVESAATITGIEIFDVTGKKLLNEPSNGVNTNLDISRLSPGYYLMNITTEKGIARRSLNILR